MPSYPSAEECRERLERAGWSGLEACVIGPGGPSWHVRILRGQALLHGEGATPEEAWRDALCLVELVDDLRDLGRGDAAGGVDGGGPIRLASATAHALRAVAYLARRVR